MLSDKMCGYATWERRLNKRSSMGSFLGVLIHGFRFAGASERLMSRYWITEFKHPTKILTY